jgi:hypothetical protein
VSQKRDRLQLKVLPQALQIVDLRSDADVVGPDVAAGPSASQPVIVDEAERIGEAVHFGEQVSEVDIRSAVEDDDRLALANVAEVQPGVADRDVALTRG